MSSQITTRPAPRAILAIAAVGIGAVAARVALQLGLPGDGWWIVVCWVLGVLAAAIWRSWASYTACVAGIVLFTAWSVVAAGQYAGLAWLVVGVEAAVLGHGFLVGAAVVRAWRLRSARDALVIAGLLTAIGLAVLFVLVAQDFARNPP